MTNKMFTNEIANATIAPDSASAMLAQMVGAASTSDGAKIALAMSVYQFQSTGAWWAINKYSGRADGFVQAVSDAVNGVQRTVESDEDYKKRWQSYRSSAYILAKAGWLATLLEEHGWGTEYSARPYHLDIVSRIVGHEALKGDMELTLSTASNLLDRVASGELIDQTALRNEVKRLLGEDVPQAKSDTKTIMVSVKANGLDDEKVKSIKAMTEAYMRNLIAIAGGKV